MVLDMAIDFYMDMAMAMATASLHLEIGYSLYLDSCTVLYSTVHEYST